jgi:hypothetical protein
MYFIYGYEDRTLKPVKIILSSGMRKNDGKDEPKQGTFLSLHKNVKTLPKKTCATDMC